MLPMIVIRWWGVGGGEKKNYRSGHGRAVAADLFGEPARDAVDQPHRLFVVFAVGHPAVLVEKRQQSTVADVGRDLRLNLTLAQHLADLRGEPFEAHVRTWH